LAALLDARAPAGEVRREEALGREAVRLVRVGELLLRGVGDFAETAGLGDQALCNDAELLRLGVGGLDTLVENEGRGQVTEHGLAAAGVTVELPTRIVVSHDVLWNP